LPNDHPDTFIRDISYGEPESSLQKNHPRTPLDVHPHRWRILVFQFNLHRKLWFPLDGHTLQMEREMINTPKVMITSSWNILELEVIEASIEKFFSADYSVQHTFGPIFLPQIVTVAHKQTKSLTLSSMLVHFDPQLHPFPDLLGYYSQLFQVPLSCFIRCEMLSYFEDGMFHHSTS
jgi:hypothetical protein